MSTHTQGTFAIEQLTPDFGFYLRTGRVLAERHSPMQHIEIVETPLFGRAERLFELLMQAFSPAEPHLHRVVRA